MMAITLPPHQHVDEDYVIIVKTLPVKLDESSPIYCEIVAQVTSIIDTLYRFKMIQNLEDDSTEFLKSINEAFQKLDPRLTVKSIRSELSYELYHRRIHVGVMVTPDVIEEYTAGPSFLDVFNQAFKD